MQGLTVAINIAKSLGATKKVNLALASYVKVHIMGATTSRKGGRAVECTALEMRHTPFGYRGFESPPFRQMLEEDRLRAIFFFFCPKLRTKKMAHKWAFVFWACTRLGAPSLSLSLLLIAVLLALILFELGLNLLLRVWAVGLSHVL